MLCHGYAVLYKIIPGNEYRLTIWISRSNKAASVALEGQKPSMGT